MKANSKWVVVGAVVLMLAAMFLYVISDDEAFPPEPTNVQQEAE